MGGVCLRGWGGEGMGGACFSSAIAHLRSHIAVLLPMIFRVVHFVCAAI